MFIFVKRGAENYCNCISSRVAMEQERNNKKKGTETKSTEHLEGE